MSESEYEQLSRMIDARDTRIEHDDTDAETDDVDDAD